MGLRLNFWRITTSGVVTKYTSTHIHLPSSITAGPDGALWFTNDFNPGHPGGDGHSIGRITTTGVVTEYTGNGISGPIGITAGPGGALWFGNGGNNSIGPITAVPMAVVTPSSGIPGTSVTLNGEGYLPGEQVNFTYETGLSSPSSVSICITTAHSDGTFSCVGDIPSSQSGALGSHKIKAKEMISLATAKTTFTLT